MVLHFMFICNDMVLLIFQGKGKQDEGSDRGEGVFPSMSWAFRYRICLPDVSFYIIAGTCSSVIYC